MSKTGLPSLSIKEYWTLLMTAMESGDGSEVKKRQVSNTLRKVKKARKVRSIEVYHLNPSSIKEDQTVDRQISLA